jgi:hypothetical protein
MKKLSLIITLVLITIYTASAQILPSFQFGAKAGMDFSNISRTGNFSTSSGSGYLAGIWMRVGALGFNFQPEAYITSKEVNIMDAGVNTQAKFTSIDVPLLVGAKIGAFGFGARFYTGPVVSFAIDKDQSYSTAASNIIRLDYKDQNYAWQAGMGLDIKKVSLDLRYEAGLSKQTYGSGSTNINLYSLTLGYRIF